MDQIIGVLNALAPLVALLVGTGLLYKYVPFLAKLPNLLIPFLNALIAFVTAFVPPVQAGIFGGLVHQVSLGARVVGALAVSALASGIYEVYLRHPLERFGIYKATSK
jgi:hypothetical protein